MPKKLKHLKYFSNYIAEQEMASPIDAGVEGEASPTVKPKEPKYTFIFIDPKDKGDYTYSDGSSSKSYNTYEIKKPNLDNWIIDNIVEDESEGLTKSAVEVKRKAMLEFISGKKSSLSPDDKQYIEKFKNSITTGVEGKKIQDTEVIFSSTDNKPTTDVVDVTFIYLPNK